MNRGEIWWASLADPSGSAPGFRRPVLVIQSDAFNASQIQTVIVVSLTTNQNLANVPGNLFISGKESGLPRDSVINVSQIFTVDKRFLTDFVSFLAAKKLQKVEDGLRLVLSI